MGNYFNRKHGSVVDMRPEEPGLFGRKRKSSVSTLLVPEELVRGIYEECPVFFRRKKPGKAALSPDESSEGSPGKRGRGDGVSIKLGLKNLLNKYRGLFAMGYLPFSEKAKLKYQDEGLDLQEVKFRPDEEDWAELGIIAYGLGVSRCWLFSYMLELERSYIAELFRNPAIRDVVATATASRPQQIVRISGRRRFLRRILHFRV